MAMLTIKRTKIDINARGCMLCGTEHSHAWRTAETIKVTIEREGQRKPFVEILELHVCGHCDGIPSRPKPSMKL